MGRSGAWCVSSEEQLAGSGASPCVMRHKPSYSLRSPGARNKSPNSFMQGLNNIIALLLRIRLYPGLCPPGAAVWGGGERLTKHPGLPRTEGFLECKIFSPKIGRIPDKLGKLVTVFQT